MYIKISLKLRTHILITVLINIIAGAIEKTNKQTSTPYCFSHYISMVVRGNSHKMQLV